MKRTLLINFGDLLSHAETLGFSWNGAHKILDDIYPYYGVREIYIDELDERGLSEDARKIVDSFIKENKIKESFSIAPKSG